MDDAEKVEGLIKIRTFGYFDVLYKNKSIFFTQSSSVKPLEIFKFFIANKDKELTADAIAENLWPENEYNNEKTVIRTYIHRLRKLIASENKFNLDFSEHIQINASKGRYILNLAGDVELDLDRMVELNGRVSTEQDMDRLEEIFRELLQIYNGSFMGDTQYAQWVVMYRNYYQRVFCNLANTILSRFLTERLYDKTVEMAEDFLKIYDLDENINIIFLKALAASDRSSVALQHYSYITSKIYNELSIAPSEKMLAVYNLIKTDKKHPQRESLPETDPIAALPGGQKLEELLDTLVKKHLNTTRYSVGYIRLEVNPVQDDGQLDGEHLREILKASLEQSLRKNDMYTVFNEFFAVVVLYDAREEHYSTIYNRIYQSFYKNYAGIHYNLKIEIAGVVNIK